MRANLLNIQTYDGNDFKDWQPNHKDFGVLVVLVVGPEGEPGEELFQLMVCTPGWLAEGFGEEPIIDGRHHLIVAEYNYGWLEHYLRQRVSECDGFTWDEVALKVGRLGYWEFEDYRTLLDKQILLLGAETEAARALAVRIAKLRVGALFALVTLTPETRAEFRANSVRDELGARTGNAGIVLLTDASDPGALAGVVEQAEANARIGRLDAACVVLGAGAVALDALREAMGERPVIEIDASVSEDDAVRALLEALEAPGG